MRYKICLLAMLVLCLALAALPLEAAVVGNLVQVEGKVEVLKQGRLPAAPAQVRDPLEPGDAVRTKSGARARVRFVDDTELTIAPGSLVTIETYMYEAAASSRQAVLQVLRGLVYCVVNRLVQAEEPNFVIKTFTAALGVRGTRWFTLVGANYTGGYNESGIIQALSTRPDLTKRVLLMGSEFSLIPLNQPPGDAQRFPLDTLNMLRQWLTTGVPRAVTEADPKQIGLLGLPGGNLLAPGPSPLDERREFPDGLFVPPKITPHQQSPSGSGSGAIKFFALHP